MGIRAVPQAPRPEPKAVCPSCSRPVALLRSGRCVYCGATVGAGGEAAEAAGQGVPAELLIALEPRAHERRNRWIGRMLAAAALVLLLAAAMGPCTAD